MYHVEVDRHLLHRPSVSPSLSCRSLSSSLSISLSLRSSPSQPIPGKDYTTNQGCTNIVNPTSRRECVLVQESIPPHATNCQTVSGQPAAKQQPNSLIGHEHM